VFWFEIEFSAEEQDSGSVVIEIAEASGSVFDRLGESF